MRLDARWSEIDDFDIAWGDRVGRPGKRVEGRDDGTTALSVPPPPQPAATIARTRNARRSTTER